MHRRAAFLPAIKKKTACERKSYQKRLVPATGNYEKHDYEIGQNEKQA